MIPLDPNIPCARFTLGSTCVEYRLEADRTVSLSFLPTDRLADRVPKRLTLEAPEVIRLPARFLPLPARTPDSLVQLHVRGKDLDLSPPSAFGQGLTMRGGEASSALKFKAQEIIESPTGTTMVTVLEAAEGFAASHFVHWPTNALFIRVSGIGYLVIDDGWAERPGAGFQQNGDWNVNRKAFPDGLKGTCDAIRAEGIVPGVWFEFEVCTEGSQAWNLTAHQLRRDGRVLRVGTRRFWDFRDPWTTAYLTEKVVALLRENGFGYLKIDYNDTIGVGVDGPDGPGENLRQHLTGVQEFVREIRRQLPQLVIENCSSGGHRLVASMQDLCAMGSFSDAHETLEIPIIAANLHQVILPRQCQVWAVLRQGDTLRRMDYSLAATFLGRVAISGDLASLDEVQMERLRAALAFSRLAAPVIADGRSRLFREIGDSWRDPCGWQVLRRESSDGQRILCVAHSFAQPPAEPIRVPLPVGRWRIAASFGDVTGTQLVGNTLTLSSLAEFAANAMLLELESS